VGVPFCFEFADSIDEDAIEDVLRCLSAAISSLLGDSRVILGSIGLDEEMEDSILAEDDVDGPDLSLDRHIAKFEFRKSCYEHSKKHAILTRNKPMCIFHVFLCQVCRMFELV
jgi:hypothetical protein